MAHVKKKLGGGLPELRTELGRRGQTEVGWHEVMKSKRVPDAVHAALATDPDLLLLWGGDGTVQRALDTVARRKTPDVPIAVLPAGTSNLFASNFDIPHELSGALDVAFGGVRKRIDVGSFNGERFGVMAGVGFDALMIGDASRRMKDRLGRAAYVYTGLKNLRRAAVNAEVCVDDRLWFTGSTPCLLVGNVGDLFGGIEVFADAQPDDGVLDVGVLTSEGPVQLLRAATRTAVGSADKSPFVRITQGRKVRVQLDRKVRYELDGGDRKKVRSFKVDVEPRAITVCVPRAARNGGVER